MSRPAPMNSSLPASAQHIAALPESAWIQHKNVLHKLYICQNKTLNEVKRTMEEEHGFPVMRPHDYEVALREVLGLRKNLTGRDWQAIKAHLDRRQNVGKKSTLFWNGMIVDERKVRKETHRKRKRSHLVSRLGTAALPTGVIIHTPPLSPIASVIAVVAPIESRPDPGTIASTASGHLAWVSYGSPARLKGAIAVLEPTQVAVSRVQELRKECPFNVFIGKLLDLSDSYHILDMVPVECTQAPELRLLGMNPSWELLARVTFEMSNNITIDWTSHKSSWFLDWFGVSADLRILQAFFSITGPTSCAIYENLCSTVHYLRRPAAANVLFKMLDTVRGNNPTVADALNFLEIAVRIGSRSNGMLDIAEWALERHAQVLDDATEHERLWLSYLNAASRGDIVMSRLLVNARARPKFGAEFHVDSSYYEAECELVLQITHKLLSWSPEETGSLNEFVQILIEGGVLLTELPSRCSNTYRPPVELFSGPVKFDEAIMLCPARKRQTLYDVIQDHNGENQTLIRHAGVFAAAAGGVSSLEAYIQSCRHDDFFDLLATMQESLVFATLLNDTKTLSSLLQIGTDPTVPFLQGNEETYKKGAIPWNPMVVAAAAGSREALMLLKEWSDIKIFLAFLERAPIYEIVRQMNLNADFHELGSGREIERLDSLRRELLYGSTVNRESQSEIEIRVESSRTKRFELLTWIRSNAVTHSATIDRDILQAALFKAPGSKRTAYRRWTEDHYCDVLLLDGLVDTNLEYHESGMDLLQLSIRNGCSLEVVEFLLSKGLKVHSRPATKTETQNTILHDALLSRSPDRQQIVNLLLQRGADCTQMGRGLTLLEASLLHSRNGQRPQDCRDLFQRLLNEGAPVPPRPQRLIKLLMYAEADDKLILRIVDTVCEVQMQEWNSQTAGLTWLPLVSAIFRQRETLARELIRRGSDVHVPAGGKGGSTALQAACSSGSSLEFIKHLVVENGADVNEPPAQELGRTALQRCTSLHVVEFLLACGADVNALSGRFNAYVLSHNRRLSFRGRALDMAAKSGRLDMLEYLLRAGGRSGHNGLRGAILLAKQHGHFTVLSVLLDWERKHGSQIIEEEAKWQREHPDTNRLLSQAACAR